ncbi:MAG: FHA domain-containing protein [Streptosporangiaceae bacterium]
MAGTSGRFEPPRPPVRASQPVRASAQEREEAVAELRERFVAGQLTQDTFVHRMETALAARDRGQLAELFADLRGSRRLHMPGWHDLAARMDIGSRARAVVAPARQAVARSARRMNPPRRPEGSLNPADLLFPVGSQARFTIGRDPDCDLVIADVTVSRQHAGLDRASQGWLLIDLGSTNGTRLNGWRVREPVPVGPGDQVSFGAVTFVLRPAPSAA